MSMELNRTAVLADTPIVLDLLLPIRRFNTIGSECLTRNEMNDPITISSSPRKRGPRATGTSFAPGFPLLRE
jgi:hypothetical protein